LPEAAVHRFALLERVCRTAPCAADRAAPSRPGIAGNVVIAIAIEVDSNCPPAGLTTRTGCRLRHARACRA
jgi:hypothetical protein